MQDSIEFLQGLSTNDISCQIWQCQICRR